MQHKTYKEATQQDADAECWMYNSSKELKKYYYKLPVLKDDEVVVRVISTGVCMSDCLTANEKWGKCQFPCVLGHEIVGQVQALGTNVTNCTVNDYVLVGPLVNYCGSCELCNKGLTHMCEGMYYHERYIYPKYFGGFSTHVQVPYKAIYKCPTNIDHQTMAPIMCAGVTTFAPIYQHVTKEHKVAIIGMGGLGHFALQWCAKICKSVDVFTSDTTKTDLIKQLGGQNVINWTIGEQYGYMNNYDVIVNTVSGNIDQDNLEVLFECLKAYGIFIQVGNSANSELLNFHPSSVINKCLTIVGSFVGGRKHYEQMFQFIQQNGVKSICEQYNWEDLPKAIDKLQNGKPHFRCVVNVDQQSQKYLKN